MKRDYKIDVYDAMLRIGNDKKSTHNQDNEVGSPNCATYAFDGKWWIVIYLPESCLRTACHESVHGALSLLDAIGHKNNSQDQEPVAYLTDYIFSKCQDFISSIK
jgi:hypothetical protein